MNPTCFSSSKQSKTQTSSLCKWKHCSTLGPCKSSFIFNRDNLHAIIAFCVREEWRAAVEVGKGGICQTSPILISLQLKMEFTKPVLPFQPSKIYFLTMSLPLYSVDTAFTTVLRFWFFFSRYFFNLVFSLLDLMLFVTLNFHFSFLLFIYCTMTMYPCFGTVILGFLVDLIILTWR